MNNLKEERLNQRKQMNCGEFCTIIKYNNTSDIDVKFDNGEILKNREYKSFKNGNISTSTKKYKSRTLNRLGETRIMNCGMKATIIRYENNTDIDVKFENGYIVNNRNYNNFKKGTINNKPIFKIKEGMKFGRLTIIKKDRFDKKHHSTYWLCKCECGNEKSINDARLKSGNTVSCGCYAREINREINFKRIPKENMLSVHNKELLEEWDYDKNEVNPKEMGYGSNKKVWWICPKGHSYNMMICSRTMDNQNCPYCSNQKVLFGYNDVYTTHPNLRKYFVNIEDSKKITVGCGKKVLLKCPNCGNEKFSILSDVTNKGFPCPSCSDGISFGEKILFNLLKDLNVSFVKEKIFDWSQNKRYDFYLENYKMIIEVMGEQHIRQTRNNEKNKNS